MMHNTHVRLPDTHIHSQVCLAISLWSMLTGQWTPYNPTHTHTHTLTQPRWGSDWWTCLFTSQTVSCNLNCTVEPILRQKTSKLRVRLPVEARWVKSITAGCWLCSIDGDYRDKTLMPPCRHLLVSKPPRLPPPPPQPWSVPSIGDSSQPVHSFSGLLKNASWEPSASCHEERSRPPAVRLSGRSQWVPTTPKHWPWIIWDVGFFSGSGWGFSWSAAVRLVVDGL